MSIQLELTYLPINARSRRRRMLARMPGCRRPPRVARHSPLHPVHVTLRGSRELPRLRNATCYAAVQRASIELAMRADDAGFRVVHLSIQATHLHALVEADAPHALDAGVTQLAATLAAELAPVVRMPAARVFGSAPHAHVLRSPAEVRQAVGYVLNNWRHHGEHTTQPWLLDPYASAVDFPGWLERGDSPLCYPRPPGYAPLFVWRPRTWLLATGWMRDGGLISAHAVPGKRAD